MVAKSPRSELLQVAEVVAREKGLSIQEVLEAMELGLQKAAKNIYGNERDIQVVIHPSSGEIKILCRYKVVKNIDNELTEMTVEEAGRRSKTVLSEGEIYEEELPPIDYGRVAAQSARNVIIQKVRQAERQHHYTELQERVGEIVNVPIKHIEFGDVFVELGRAEAILRKDQQLPHENFRTGDRIRALLVNLRPESKGPIGVLSRIHPQFLERLFEQEIPEVYDGIIEIRAVARDPGSRAKVAVYTPDTLIDPIGACVGPKGNRIQAISHELKGERIDVIPWSADPATFVANALAPSEVTRIVVDEERGRIEVAVPQNQLSLAIGRRGQNVKLASQLTNARIDIVTEEEDIERRSHESLERIAIFQEVLQLDDITAQFLVSHGFLSLEDVAFVDSEEFYALEGFDEKTVDELQKRARTFLENQNEEILEKLRSLGVEDALLDLFETELIMKLVEKDVKTLDDLAGLSVDELTEIIDIPEDEAGHIIMQVRNRCFTN